MKAAQVRAITPRDSILHYWMDRWLNTEVYPSWQLCTGLAVIGAALRRNVCFNAGGAGEIFPNLSTILVGPSGDGKNTIINPACSVLDEVGTKMVAGKTIEAVKESLHNIGNPAVGYIKAAELAEFLGSKDYQQGIIQSITDILSNDDWIDITMKSDIKKGQKNKRIERPTLTMFGGSTKEWFAMLPPGTMEGGFLPRFIIPVEISKADAGIRPVANPNVFDSPEQRRLALDGKNTFTNKVKEIAMFYEARGSMTTFVDNNGMDSAEAWYTNWYSNRFKDFDNPVLHAFANRSGGLMRRIALVMAVSRGHTNYIELEDYLFAHALLKHIAERLEIAVISQSREVVAGDAIKQLLPNTGAQLLRMLSGKFTSQGVQTGIRYLLDSEQITLKGGLYHRVESK